MILLYETDGILITLGAIASRLVIRIMIVILMDGLSCCATTTATRVQM